MTTPTPATVESVYNHSTTPVIGVLLSNLGTPQSPEPADVRRFLKEFLWDPRVVELPRPLWWLVLNGVILNTRPRRSARAYKKIWTDKGSPLAVIITQQVKALRGAFANHNVIVEPAMRYGAPSLASGLEKLRQQGADRILVLPLYPQYSATTTGSTFDAVAGALKTWRRLPEMRFVNHYHDHPGYIAALASSISRYWQQHGQADKLLLSFHGIPEEYFHKGDPYFCECQKTARLLADKLNLDNHQFQVSFQSRLGTRQWLQPYTDKVLQDMASSGVRSVQVCCPGFSADCVETLEEVAMENRDVFLNSGGKQYEYIPCLNDSQAHIDFLKKLIDQHIAGWQIGKEGNITAVQRATSMGASQ